jgi:hypothetical protein
MLRFTFARNFLVTGERLRVDGTLSGPNFIACGSIQVRWTAGTGLSVRRIAPPSQQFSLGMFPFALRIDLVAFGSNDDHIYSLVKDQNMNFPADHISQDHDEVTLGVG